ncbi:MAG: hypothetical protein HY074_01155 [Deltaproteobacteria bacterium]|nr:hypothetical protein [Deltaproteobacteria bacterium]
MRLVKSVPPLAAALVVAMLGMGCGGGGAYPKHDALGSGESLTQAGALNARNLAELQLHHSRAVVSPQPWAAYWWPYVGSGIANGWRDPDNLAPADKYDRAYRGAHEPLADWERARHGPGLANVASWWGHCNGWAAAALMVSEPRLPKFINGVSFGVRDQKALLAESWMEFSGDFIGTRVDEEKDLSSAAFWDVVPAQFHLVLTNIVGKQNHGLILDRHTGHEIWNQPLVAYDIAPITRDDYLGSHPSYPDIYRVNVTARIWWANDAIGPDEITPPFDMEKLHEEYFDHFFPGRLLRYELWLDAPAEFDAQGKLVRSGDILITRRNDVYVGGAWKNGINPALLAHTHPDYMWVPFSQQRSSGYKNPRIDDQWVRANIGEPAH